MLAAYDAPYRVFSIALLAPCSISVGTPMENILMDVPEKHPGYTHMALDVTDIETTEASIRNLGIEITEGPITLPDGG
jgi:hypothetical protein